MNERIQDLVKQCETLDGDHSGIFTRFDKEKFAKLIVLKCAKVAEESDTLYTGVGYDAAVAIRELLELKNEQV